MATCTSTVEHGWKAVPARKKRTIAEPSLTSSQVRRIVTDYYGTGDLKTVLGDDDVVHLVSLLTRIESTHFTEDMMCQIRMLHKDKRRMQRLTHDSITPVGVLLRLRTMVRRLKTQNDYSFTDVGHVVAVFYTLTSVFPSCIPTIYDFLGMSSSGDLF